MMSEGLTSSNLSNEETISLYERQLESSPNDLAVLESLAAAYGRADNTLRARATLIRLSRVIVSKRDAPAAARVAEKLRPHAEADFDALEALASLETLLREVADAGGAGAGAVSDASPESTPPPPEGVALDKLVLKREVDLAWGLRSDGLLKEEEYSQIVEDLTVQMSKSRGAAVSVLHAVVDRAIPGFDGIVQHLQDKGRVPFIDLDAFEPQRVDHREVPSTYLIRQGAVVFDEVGDELLVGILNPVDKAIREDLPRYLGAPCHFFLVAPEAFDRAWGKIGD